MPTKIVLGAQWGDEGKAKVVDYLTLKADVVVRYQGGANAGHTVIVGDTEFVFHMIPSGIMHEDKACVVGNGVVIDPEAMLAEIDDLEGKGFSVAGRFFVSHIAHMVMPYHKALEKASEESKDGVKIGTTGRGIGPAYRDKVERTHGVRVMDLLDPARLRDKLRASINAKNEILTKVYGQDPLDVGLILDAYVGYGERLAPYVTDASVYLNQAIDQGKQVLFEGAQGTLLDIDHGTYPYVTSSNTTAGGACTGTGIGPTRIDEVIGVTKAYTTRVGSGPFPTELEDEIGTTLGERGHEFGTVTGRKRRCGWFDAVLVRQAVKVNGINGIALTKIDVLDGIGDLKVCTGYRIDGVDFDYLPASSVQQANVEPIYETMEGWDESTEGARSWADLPATAVKYIRRIEELIEAPVSLLSTSPEREDSILVHDPFAD